MSHAWHRFYDAGVPETVTIPPDTLPGVLDDTVKRYADRPALRFFVDPKLPPSSQTYRQVQDATLRFATALYQLGVRKGDRVAIMLPNCPEFVTAFYGVLRIGGIVVNTNPLYVSREMKEQFNDAGAETVVLLDQFFPRLREIAAATRIRRIVVVDVAGSLAWPVRALVHAIQRKHGELVRVRPQSNIYYFRHLLENYPPTPPGADLRPSDVALFQYTGGTTGVPKAAMLSHGNLVANTVQVAKWFAKMEEGKEVFMAAIPFFHVYGMTTCMILGIHAGGEIVMVPRPRPVDNVMKVIQKVRATIFPGVPTLYTAINNHPDVKTFDLTSVKFCLSGAAPLPVEVAEVFERLTGGKLVEGYGMTEASPVTHCNPLYGARKVGSIGIPVPGTEARIVDLETGQPVAVGTAGELVVRGPQVMLGYWSRPEETAQTIRDGWLHTGDVAKMDDDGFFYVVDRKKDMIACSGLKVLPREVEEVLFLHPKVAEAAVAGIPDPYRGETVKAFVVLKEGQEATADEIIRFCRIHLASFKVPTAVEIRKELPKTAIGKVLRRVLVEEEKERTASGGVAPPKAH